MAHLQSDPENLIYIIHVTDGYADSLELEGYRETPVETEEVLPDGWYRVMPPEYKQDATEYPELDDDLEWELIPDPTRPGEWNHDI